ncbi:serine protease [Actinoplanes sp. NPDC024001]|uniref:trypsin-like serine peptidase n=1 Tax=Actinoplanes sp. NPDC024001 TaxID=3154598 RepID=UPI0033D344AA
MPSEDSHPTRGSLELPAAVVSPAGQKELAQALSSALSGQRWREEPLHRKAEFARRAGVTLAPGADARTTDMAVERIIGNRDLLPGIWLQRGAEVSDAVALVRTPAGDGTGFLVSPWLLMTNEHVLPTAEEAAQSTIRFRYQENAAGRIGRTREHALDPDRFYVTDKELDYALVAVAGTGNSNRGPGQTFGFIPLIGATGKILLGQPVNIIQHAGGRPREIAVRENLLVDLDDTILTYAADTQTGSSGSPVFSDRWELVGLHRRGLEARDADGQPIDINGHPVTDHTPEEQRHWVANQGSRVSSIVTDLASRSFTSAQQILVTELLATGGSR